MFSIALKMLFHDRAKYLGLVLGVAFSTLLINQQLGIFIGLITRAGAVIVDVPQADVWVMDPGVKNLDTIFPLRDTELGRVRGVPGVAWPCGEPRRESSTQESHERSSASLPCPGLWIPASGSARPGPSASAAW